jgi:hypothetical protein
VRMPPRAIYWGLGATVLQPPGIVGPGDNSLLDL